MKYRRTSEILTKENIDKYLKDKKQLHMIAELIYVNNRSQYDVANMLYISRSMISRLEKRAIKEIEFGLNKQIMTIENINKYIHDKESLIYKVAILRFINDYEIMKIRTILEINRVYHYEILALEAVQDGLEKERTSLC